MNVRQRVFVGLGSNQKQPVVQIQKAITIIQAKPEWHLEAVSSCYQSAPMGDWGEQPDFVNAVATFDTEESAKEVLAQLLHIEDLMGRTRDGRYGGPRVIDLDLLLYGDTCSKTNLLTLPHPGIYDRDFVLVPLAEIAANLILPNGLSVAEQAAGLSQTHLRLVQTIGA